MLDVHSPTSIANQLAAQRRERASYLRYGKEQGTASRHAQRLASVITSKAANDYQVKTGQRK